jgi:hypothetical protein
METPHQKLGLAGIPLLLVGAVIDGNRIFVWLRDPQAKAKPFDLDQVTIVRN